MDVALFRGRVPTDENDGGAGAAGSGQSCCRACSPGRGEQRIARGKLDARALLLVSLAELVGVDPAPALDCD